MTFTALIVITLALWAVLFAASYALVRGVHRAIGSRLVWRTILVAGALFIMRIGVIDDQFSETSLAILGIIAMVIMGSLAIIIVAFMIYHGIRHGNPMMDYDADPIVVKKIEMKVKKEKKWCPMCMANTGCRVRQNPYTKIWVHVMR